MCELRLMTIAGEPPTSLYEIYSKDEYVGACYLHHKDRNEAHLPADFTSHIYYEILQEYRGKGFAKRALEKLVVAARHMGLSNVFLVVAEENIPSQKVIEGRGARFLSSKLGTDGVMYRRYEISCAEQGNEKTP